jgi:hypothetical protein
MAGGKTGITTVRNSTNDIIPENNVTISITDPNNTYKYVDINGTEIVNYTVNKDSMKNLMIRILPKSSS